MLNNKSQNYNFYLLEAILLLMIDMENDLSLSFLQVCHIHDVLKNGGLHKTVKTTIFNKVPLLQLLLY